MVSKQKSDMGHAGNRTLVTLTGMSHGGRTAVYSCSISKMTVLAELSPQGDMIYEHLTINSIVSLYIPVWCLMVFLVLALQCAPFHILVSVKAENKIRNGQW